MNVVKKGACHTGQLKKLNRIQGQVGGIAKMIEDRRYCVDILIQIKAAKSALGSIEKQIINDHLDHCVQEAIASKNSKKTDEALAEIREIIKSARLS